MPPPSCANGAANDAPKPYPTIMSGILVGANSSASSTVYSRPTPRRLIATTNSPLTAPPRSAIWSALLRLERAALAVRMLERTATYMPTRPATPEQNAPNRKDRAVVSASVAAAGSTEGGLLKNVYNTYV